MKTNTTPATRQDGKFTNFENLNYTGFARIKDTQTGARGYLYKNINPDPTTLEKLKTASNVTFVCVGCTYSPEQRAKSVILWDKAIKPSKITARREAYAAALEAAGLELSRGWYRLSYSEMSTVGDIARSFGYRYNNPASSAGVPHNFWNSAQKARNY